MNKDTVKGKAKDVAGRIERQVGEWTGDPEKQGKGAAKQAEGKLQNAWGKLKDGVEKAGAAKPSAPKPPQRTEEADEDAAEREG
jgi:uncharacterized protein YjbJ (UPF0337 family)